MPIKLAPRIEVSPPPSLALECDDEQYGDYFHESGDILDLVPALGDLGIYTFQEAKQWAIDNPLTWIVDKWVPEGSVCLCSAVSKSGKTETMRTLVYCTVTGQDFLGRAVSSGTVLLYTLEDTLVKQVELFTRNGVDPEGKLFIAQDIPDDWNEVSPVEYIKYGMQATSPKLVIVDMFQHMFGSQVDDYNDYGKVSKQFIALNKMVKTCFPKSAVIVTHHQRKPPNSRGDGALAGMHEILGSTAFAGRPYTCFFMDKHRTNNLHYISTTGRSSEGDMEPTPTEICEQTGLVVLCDKASVPEEKKAAKLPTDFNSRVKQCIAAVHRYIITTGQLTCPQPMLWSWSQLPKGRYGQCLNYACNDNKLKLVAGRGTKGHPYEYVVHPDYVITDEVLATKLPIDDNLSNGETLEEYKTWLAKQPKAPGHGLTKHRKRKKATRGGLESATTHRIPGALVTTSR